MIEPSSAILGVVSVGVVQSWLYFLTVIILGLIIYYFVGNFEIFGKCNNPNGHGHDYYLELTVIGKISDKTGMIVHLDDLDLVADSIIEPLDHKRLDIEIEYFTKVRASGENIAKYLWNEFVNKIPKPARLYHIRLWETSENFFDYRGE